MPFAIDVLALIEAHRLVTIFAGEERDAADHRKGGNQHRGEDGTANAEFGELLHERNLAWNYDGAEPADAIVTGAVS